MKEGDRNTNFFHQAASRRRQKNTTGGLYNELGVWYNSPQQLGNILFSYYKYLFFADHGSNMHDFDLKFDMPKWSPTYINLLCALLSEQEVELTINDLTYWKASRPDGMPTCFFQVYWNFIKHDLFNLILDLFYGRDEIGRCNHMFLSLLPKHSNIAWSADFRPIGLCNTIYKVLAKIICACLKPILSDIIELNQEFFLKVENVHIMQLLCLKCSTRF